MRGSLGDREWTGRRRQVPAGEDLGTALTGPPCGHQCACRFTDAARTCVPLPHPWEATGQLEKEMRVYVACLDQATCQKPQITSCRVLTASPSPWEGATMKVSVWQGSNRLSGVK